MAKSNWERKDLMDGKESLCPYSLSLLCIPVDFHNPTPEFFFSVSQSLKNLMLNLLIPPP